MYGFVYDDDSDWYANSASTTLRRFQKCFHIYYLPDLLLDVPAFTLLKSKCTCSCIPGTEIDKLTVWKFCCSLHYAYEFEGFKFQAHSQSDHINVLSGTRKSKIPNLMAVPFSGTRKLQNLDHTVVCFSGTHKSTRTVRLCFCGYLKTQRNITVRFLVFRVPETKKNGARGYIKIHDLSHRRWK